MHSYKGTNNNIYHFNGDCSGDLIITEVVNNKVKNEMRIDFKDIINIINEKGYGLKVIETEEVEENMIDELRQYIDKKIVESINKEEYSNIEVQEILEEIDSKIDDIRLIYGVDKKDD